MNIFVNYDFRKVYLNILTTLLLQGRAYGLLRGRAVFGERMGLLIKLYLNLLC